MTTFGLRHLRAYRDDSVLAFERMPIECGAAIRRHFHQLSEAGWTSAG